MSEVSEDLSPFEASLRERSSVLAGYVALAGLHAAAPDFAEEVRDGARRANTVGTWEDGDPITEDDSLALASASVLSQITTAYAAHEHLKLRPWVEDEMPLYQRTLAVMQKVGLFFDKSILDTGIARATIDSIFEQREAPNEVASVAADVWWARGSIPLSTDVYNKLPIGVERPMDDPEIVAADVPFYLSFMEPRHATWWLSSLLDDLVTIDERLGPVGVHIPGERS